MNDDINFHENDLPSSSESESSDLNDDIHFYDSDPPSSHSEEEEKQASDEAAWDTSELDPSKPDEKRLLDLMAKHPRNYSYRNKAREFEVLVA